MIKTFNDCLVLENNKAKERQQSSKEALKLFNTVLNSIENFILFIRNEYANMLADFLDNDSVKTRLLKAITENHKRYIKLIMPKTHISEYTRLCSYVIGAYEMRVTYIETDNRRYFDKLPKNYANDDVVLETEKYRIPVKEMPAIWDRLCESLLDFTDFDRCIELIRRLRSRKVLDDYIYKRELINVTTTNITKICKGIFKYKKKQMKTIKYLLEFAKNNK